MKNERHNLKIIQGGLKSPQQREKKFLKAFATNTRLMGIFAVAIFWEIENSPDSDGLFQYITFDTTEQAIESYEEAWGKNNEKISPILNSVMKRLGGRNVRLSEDEVIFLVKKYFSPTTIEESAFDNLNRQLGFILSKNINFTNSDIAKLESKLTKKLSSIMETINYSLMRYLAKDFQALAYTSDLASLSTNSEAGAKKAISALSPPTERLKAYPVWNRHYTEQYKIYDVFPDIKPATLIRNITKKLGKDSFQSKSYVENSDGYYLIFSDVRLLNSLVVDISRVNILKISWEEIMLTKNKTEYIGVYDLEDANNYNREVTLNLPESSIARDFDKGTLFMIFRTDNDHVKLNPFDMSDDVAAIEFISANGQLIIAASGIDEFEFLEDLLLTSESTQNHINTGRYQSQQQLIYNYIMSPYTDFNKFIERFYPDMKQ